jgi:hypothetical protein
MASFGDAATFFGVYPASPTLTLETSLMLRLPQMSAAMI